MLFAFRPEHMIGLANGTLQQVVSSSGTPLSMVRDSVTGQIVGHAPSIISNPLTAIPEMLLSGVQIVQNQKTHTMLEMLQNTVGVLQATTTVIGVGTVAGVALSAVNLHQILKLKQDVKQLRLEVKEGFIDLKQALKDQGTEIIQRIDQVAQDVEFKHHRTILVQAYGLFAKAIKRLQSALKLQDLNLRDAEINAARDMLFKALADYDNPHLLEDSCCAGQLRRQECVWAIDQAITMTYQLQGASDVVSTRLGELQNKIRQDTLMVAESCETDDEVDFIFPEITRIINHDLVILESWKGHVDYSQTLSPSELQLLVSSDMQISDSSDDNQNSNLQAKPEEQLLYDTLKQKSHCLSLCDQLKFIIKPDLRCTHESYISEQASACGYNALNPSNWKEIPDLTVANLYWYFKIRDESEAVA